MHYNFHDPGSALFSILFLGSAKKNSDYDQIEVVIWFPHMRVWYIISV